MKPVARKMARTKPMYGWMNRILRIDLSNLQARCHESREFVPDFLAARGIAAKIAWDEYPEPVTPFDPSNPLMIIPGALTGTPSPYSGRTSVCSFSPQGYPHPWFTRSNIGGWIGGEIKRAGYDGIIVTGKAEQPVKLHITDDIVTFLPADELWGMDALDTLDYLKADNGSRTRSLAIGPAGEHLSRIATIQTDTSSACGQGGFGAVMGSKNLKAISVNGTYEPALAHPEAIVSLARQIAKVAKPPRWFGKDLGPLNEKLAREGGGRARFRACTESCVTPCQVEFRNMPGRAFKRQWRGDWVCAGLLFEGLAREEYEYLKNIYDWHLDRRAAFEMNVLSNRYGLNQFDILYGMVPWLIACQKAGLISTLNGKAIDWFSPEFWADFLHTVAYREGTGDALAEGGWAASRKLGLGKDFAQRYYPGWGHPSHWDGRNAADLPFPFWVASALQWLSDTRDPFSTGHGSLSCSHFWRQANKAKSKEVSKLFLEKAREFGRRVYDTEAAADWFSGYRDKAKVGYFHTIRPVIKDCVPIDDLVFPLLLNDSSHDYAYHFSGVKGLPDFDGKDMEYYLFKLGTGTEWDIGEFELAAGRVFNLERAVLIRHWGRNRSMDEMVLPFFEQPEGFKNPFLEKRHKLDRKEFKVVLDEFYSLHGWNPETGRPTRQRLSELGLGYVSDTLRQKAARSS
jgi:aldehyde:ferredoxin oxidoreductase